MSAEFNTCPRRRCRGFTDHSQLRHWAPVMPTHFVPFVWKARLGIALKELGCRLIHGPGHFYGPVVDLAGELRRYCRSCGKTLDIRNHGEGGNR